MNLTYNEGKAEIYTLEILTRKTNILIPGVYEYHININCIQKSSFEAEGYVNV